MKALSRAACVGPGLMFSTVVWWWVGLAMPDWMTWGWYLGLGLGGLALFLGVGESWAVRALFSAQAPTACQRRALSAVTAQLRGLEIGPPGVQMLLARRPGAPTAVARGRRSVVVSQELVQAMLSHRADDREVLTAFVRAFAVLDGGLSSRDAITASWSAPWRVATRLWRASGLERTLAWRARPVLFAVAIYQALSGGWQANGLVGASALAVILTLTYLCPAGARRWERCRTVTGDRAAVRLGLATRKEAPGLVRCEWGLPVMTSANHSPGPLATPGLVRGTQEGGPTVPHYGPSTCECGPSLDPWQSALSPREPATARSSQHVPVTE